MNECEDPALSAYCAENAECCNLPGHFVCKCRPGFTGNATQQCDDLDECASADSCGRGAVCENRPGSFACTCPAGYTGDPQVECWGELKAIRHCIDFYLKKIYIYINLTG